MASVNEFCQIKFSHFNGLVLYFFLTSKKENLVVIRIFKKIRLFTVLTGITYGSTFHELRKRKYIICTRVNQKIIFPSSFSREIGKQRHLVTDHQDPGAAQAKSSDDQTNHCQIYMESKHLLQSLTKDEVKIVERYEWT